MKKVLLTLTLLISSLTFMCAQDTIVLNVEDVPVEPPMQVCCGTVIAIYATEQNCNDWFWELDNVSHGMENPLIIQSQVEHLFRVEYNGCDISLDCHIEFYEPSTILPFTEIIWKRDGETLTLDPVQFGIYGNSFHWASGENTPSIDVIVPGIYILDVNDYCGIRTFTFIVHDNVEIYRAGVDPATNLNKVRWNTTPEQAEYISQVKVERDGMVVGIAPYLDGEFLDNIGSENAARVYKITAIDTDGNECPLPSYQFGTFNTIISPDIANPSLMNFTWEDPFIEEGLPYSVIAYRIGRFNEDTGEFIMIDQLSANVHLGKYNMDLFGGDYGIVAAVFNDTKNRDYEKLAFSNRSDSGIVGIDELDNDNIKVYPNPANGMFLVEGTGILHITNALGQTIQTKEIDGKTIVELPQGLYFVKLNGVTQKIVVE